MTYPTYCKLNEKDFREIRYENVPVCKRNVSSELKRDIYKDYGIPVEDRKDYTIDHMVPLSMGGSNKKTNLWPQHKNITTAPLEAEVFRRLSKGDITHAEAIKTILDHKLDKGTYDE